MNESNVTSRWDPRKFNLLLTSSGGQRLKQNPFVCCDWTFLKGPRAARKNVSNTLAMLVPYKPVVFCFSAYDYVIPARGKILAKTDLQIALPDGCYGRVGKIPVQLSETAV